ncbi:MAG: twitching motility protein PilT [Comamonas sp. SCN 65-56]|uniref:PIN domain-containing protein n=1 Tax=Comamonas sp. SCN 65-56 TaxID=1660095 RepID=UPI000868FF1F|nr:PIN domain-containing protein [Comamonas sp. SCN 65-56]ODS93875.1 MAG: twitching motility protein PilT [Comamonas sp. SCN 65-56]
MSAADFIDSNVVVYAFDSTGGEKSTIASHILNTALRQGNAIISFQVVQETLHVIGRKFNRVATLEDRQSALAQILVPLWRIHPSPALYTRGLDIQERYGFSFCDSLIVAAALEGHCTRLLSEDMQHGQQIQGLRVENPFLDVQH